MTRFDTKPLKLGLRNGYRFMLDPNHPAARTGGTYVWHERGELSRQSDGDDVLLHRRHRHFKVADQECVEVKRPGHAI